MACIAQELIGQNLIAVQNGGAPSFYTILDTALLQAQNGDTVYLPGGTLTCGTITVNKALRIFGMGINGDSSVATKTTQINGSLYLDIEAGGSSLTGFSLNGLSLNFSASDIHVSRCGIGSLTINAGTAPPSTNNVFYENTIGSINGSYAQGNTFFNNIISYFMSNLGPNNLFRNNIFQLAYPWFCGNENYGHFVRFSSSFFENNIFLHNSVSWCPLMCSSDNCNFRNNIFIDDLDVDNLCPDCHAFDNFVNQQSSTVFIEGTYHLQPTCPGKNTGTDGTDIGIYGGLHPWKDGSIPANPHIQFKNIDNSTDLNGNINVNIKVAAQDR